MPHSRSAWAHSCRARDQFAKISRARWRRRHPRRFTATRRTRSRKLRGLTRDWLGRLPAGRDLLAVSFRVAPRPKPARSRLPDEARRRLQRSTARPPSRRAARSLSTPRARDRRWHPSRPTIPGSPTRPLRCTRSRDCLRDDRVGPRRSADAVARVAHPCDPPLRARHYKPVVGMSSGGAAGVLRSVPGWMARRL